MTNSESSMVDAEPTPQLAPYGVTLEVDPKGWTKFGRRLDGAAG